jgi:hypothetical protein
MLFSEFKLIKLSLFFLSSNLESYFCTPFETEGIAKVAQLVERDLAKVEVAGSNPVFRSHKVLPGWWNW